jgi:hypothetical protein
MDVAIDVDHARIRKVFLFLLVLLERAKIELARRRLREHVVQERVAIRKAHGIADGDRDEIRYERAILLRDQRRRCVRRGCFLVADDVDDRFGFDRLAVGIRDRDLADDASDRARRRDGRQRGDDRDDFQNAIPQLSFGASRIW